MSANQVLCQKCGKDLMYMNDYNVKWFCFCSVSCAKAWKNKK